MPQSRHPLLIAIKLAAGSKTWWSTRLLTTLSPSAGTRAATSFFNAEGAVRSVSWQQNFDNRTSALAMVDSLINVSATGINK